MIHQILIMPMIDGPKPRFPDLSLLATLLTHYSYASVEDATLDGVVGARKFNVKLTIEIEDAR